MLATLFASVASGQAADDQQPSPENDTLYLWGDASLASGTCFTHFSSDETTEFGFGEFEETENIDFSCSLSEPLSQEMFLNSGVMINGKVVTIKVEPEYEGKRTILKNIVAVIVDNIKPPIIPE